MSTVSSGVVSARQTPRVAETGRSHTARFPGRAVSVLATGGRNRGEWKDHTVTADLTARARAGDQEAFRELVDPYQHELQVHCYRILGSAQDAEDALQETLLAAWRGLGGFEERASIRTWLYRIATSRCLNTLRASSRRVTMDGPQSWPDPPQPTRLGEVPWLEPYPDLLLDELPGTEPGPAARYEATEAISLAFITALQLLPPRQRAVLVLRDVLGFSTAEAAGMLQATSDSAASALKRARATLARRFADAAGHEPPPAPDSPAERALVRHLTEAYATGDVTAVISLLTDDVWLTMPPVPFEYQGREVAGRALALLFGRGLRYRLVATRANGQPAFGLYVNDPRSGVLHANGLMVLTLAGDRISALARFDNSSLARFGLPRTLDA
jgi:RNA polymerase sigma-70 factor (TIGR02960 family)